MNLPSMYFRPLLVAAAFVLLATPAAADDRAAAKSQVEFGIKVAQSGLWKEARYRWEKAVELDPKNLLIRQNYDLFKEINDRTQKRRGDR